MTPQSLPSQQANEATMSLKEQLAEFRSGWFKRVPAERQVIMARHIAELRDGLAKTSLKAGDRAPPVVLSNAKGEIVDVGLLLENGPVVITFYRGGWCRYCNLELRAYQRVPSGHQGGRCVAGRYQPGKAG
jgi:hypothetical protein